MPSFLIAVDSVVSIESLTPLVCILTFATSRGCLELESERKCERVDRARYAACHHARYTAEIERIRLVLRLLCDSQLDPTVRDSRLQRAQQRKWIGAVRVSSQRSSTYLAAHRDAAATAKLGRAIRDETDETRSFQ